MMIIIKPMLGWKEEKALAMVPKKLHIIPNGPNLWWFVMATWRKNAREEQGRKRVFLDR